MDFKRQNLILNPEDVKQPIHIFGLGTIGSFTALSLAKTGAKILNLWDFDKIEEHNVPNQFYFPDQVNVLKAISLQNLLHRFNPTALIRIHDIRINDLNISLVAKEINPQDIIILAFDNLEARKLVFKASKRLGVFIIDGRMAREEFRIFSGYSLDKKFVDRYERSLNPEKTIEVECGERSICYNALAIASFISSQVKKIVKGEKYPFEVSFSLNNYQAVIEW